MSIADAIVFIFCNLFWAAVVIMILLLKDDKNIRNIFPPKQKPEDDPDRYGPATDENIIEDFLKRNERAKAAMTPVPMSEILDAKKKKEPDIE